MYVLGTSFNYLDNKNNIFFLVLELMLLYEIHVLCTYSSYKKILVLHRILEICNLLVWDKW